jgi:hypothetical protein
MPPVARACPHTISTNGSAVLNAENRMKSRHSASVAGRR